MKNGDAMTKFPEFWPAYLVCARAHMVQHRATKYDRITQHREGKFYMVDGDMAYYVSPQLICTVWYRSTRFCSSWLESCTMLDDGPRSLHSSSIGMETVVGVPCRWKQILQDPQGDGTNIVALLYWKPDGHRKRRRPKNTWRQNLDKEMQHNRMNWWWVEAAAWDRRGWWRVACAALGVKRLKSVKSCMGCERYTEMKTHFTMMLLECCASSGKIIICQQCLFESASRENVN